ncbi:hypothetical protein ES703_121292 [subsurface metagenome]
MGRLGRDEEALESYDKAIEINPDYELAWYNRGVSLEQLDRDEEALESYDRVIKINPENDLAKQKMEEIHSKRSTNDFN